MSRSQTILRAFVSLWVAGEGQTARSRVLPPTRASRSGSLGPRLSVIAFGRSFMGPVTVAMLPDLRMISCSKPMIPVPPENVPAAMSTPVYEMLLTVTTAARLSRMREGDLSASPLQARR